MGIHRKWVLFIGCLLSWAIPHTLKAQTEQIDSLLTQAQGYNDTDLSVALELCKQALDLAVQFGSTEHIGYAQLVIGRTFANLGELDSALVHFQLARGIYIGVNDSLHLAETYAKLHYAHLYLGNADSSLFHALECLRLYEGLNQKRGMAVALSKAAESLNTQNKFEEALEYALQGVKHAEESQDSIVLADVLTTTAANYTRLEQFEKALQFQNKAIGIFEQVGNSLDIAINLNSRGNIYKLAGDFELAYLDYTTGLELGKPYGYSGLDRALMANVGDVLVRTDRFEEALSVLKEVAALDRSFSNKRDAPEPLLRISEAYEGLGQFDSAYLYRIAYEELSDSLFNADADQRMSDIRTKYETEKVEAQNEFLEQRQQQQQILLWVAMAGILAIGIIALLLFQNNRRKRRTNVLLASQNNQIEQKNQQNETLLKEIHHRVKNNLQVISSLLRLQSSHIEDDAVRKVVAAGEHRVKSMAMIHQKLYQRENLSGVEMKDYLTTLGKSLIDTLGDRETSIQLIVDMPELELDVDTAVPLGLIANELITNSLKYAFTHRESGEIRLSLELNDRNTLELMVADDGVGSGGISVIGGKTSFGSRLIHLLCMQLDGELRVETDAGRRTKVAIRDFSVLASPK
ncbi:MAG: histidine kinase dimerization/phosphoacceptor domain -containing protein [Bacteroidota bacterium]